MAAVLAARQQRRRAELSQLRGALPGVGVPFFCVALALLWVVRLVRESFVPARGDLGWVVASVACGVLVTLLSKGLVLRYRVLPALAMPYLLARAWAIRRAGVARWAHLIEFGGHRLQLDSGIDRNFLVYVHRPSQGHAGGAGWLGRGLGRGFGSSVERSHPESGSRDRGPVSSSLIVMVDAGNFSENRVTELVSGRFRMRRLVAFGGMANIYEAEDLKTGRVGALKLLKARFRHVPDAVERLSREASVATRIADAHIVQTFDAGRLDSGEPFLFMELLGGETLSQRIVREGALPIVDAVDIVAQAAQGLCVAHAADVLHRDIKPANLFLVAGPKVFVKLLDFGVSKFVGTGAMSLTREGLALGTFSYMPPEQMMGAKRVDARADIYSLGVVLYQCLVGTPPFVAKSILALSNLMARSEYTRVSQLRSDAPRELDSILWRSLRADPNDRYPSARDLREDLLRLARRSLPQRTLSVGAASPVPPAVAAPAVSRSASPRPPAVSRAAAVPAAFPLRSAAVSPSSSPPRSARAPESARAVPRAPTRMESLVETIIPRTRRQGERER